MRRLILGVGTGRCGTKSLVRLLSAQSRTKATHERFGSKVRWNCPKNLWPLRLWRDTAPTEGVPPEDGPAARADVALNWTPHVETFLNWADRDGRVIRVVGLKRGRQETIDSYLRWKPNADHWSFHGDRSQEPDKWDHAYPPDPGARSKAEAIGRFWDRVYGMLEFIEDDRVRVFRTEDLNTEEGVRSILRHCGYQDPTVEVRIHIKAPTIEDARNSTQWT